MKLKHIVLWYGHNYKVNGIFDPGATFKNLKEATEVYNTVHLLKNYLEAQGYKVTIIDTRNMNFKSQKEAHEKIGEMVQALGADLCLNIHENDGPETATGVECFVHSTNSKAYPHARNIVNSISSTLGIRNRGVKVKKDYWTFIYTGDVPSIIIEGGFIKTDVYNGILTIETYAKCIAQAFGTVEDSKDKDKAYRVQLGAYSIRNNADKLLKDLEQKGFKGFIKSEVVNNKNLYRVQLGYYLVRENADKMLQDLRNKGFNGFIAVEEIAEKEMKNKSEYIKKGDARIIKTTPDNIYISILGDNLKNKGVYGINGTFFDLSTAPVTSPNSCVFIAMNNGKALSNNASINGYNAPPRGTIIYYEDGTLGNRKIKNIKELSKPAKWVIGGYTVKPYMDFANEKMNSGINYKTAHSYIGYDSKGYVYLIVKPNHLVQEIVPLLNDLGIVQCILLDGGGSSQLNHKEGSYHSSRKVNSIIGIKSV